MITNINLVSLSVSSNVEHFHLYRKLIIDQTSDCSDFELPLFDEKPRETKLPCEDNEEWGNDEGEVKNDFEMDSKLEEVNEVFLVLHSFLEEHTPPFCSSDLVH